MVVRRFKDSSPSIDSLMFDLDRLLTMQQEDCQQIVAEGYKNKKYVLTFIVTMNPETESRSLNAQLELLKI